MSPGTILSGKKTAPAPRAAGPPIGVDIGTANIVVYMNGHGDSHAPAQAPRAQPPLAARPPRQEVYDEAAEHDPEQERIEIPAFLRRQAN